MPRSPGASRSNVAGVGVAMGVIVPVNKNVLSPTNVSPVIKAVALSALTCAAGSMPRIRNWLTPVE